MNQEFLRGRYLDIPFYWEPVRGYAIRWTTGNAPSLDAAGKSAFLRRGAWMGMKISGADPLVRGIER